MIGGAVVVIVIVSVLAAVVANKSTTGPTNSPALVTTGIETTTTAANDPPQVFKGAGTENLGAISITTPSTLEWTCRGCLVFAIEGHTNDFGSLIDIDDSNRSSGVSAVEPGTYESVDVAADEGETNAGWSIEVRAR
jgi:hypothetical protein